MPRLGSLSICLVMIAKQINTNYSNHLYDINMPSHHLTPFGRIYTLIRFNIVILNYSNKIIFNCYPLTFASYCIGSYDVALIEERALHNRVH